MEFATSSGFCAHAQASKASAIKDKEEKIDLLTTQMAKSVADIAELVEDVTNWKRIQTLGPVIARPLQQCENSRMMITLYCTRTTPRRSTALKRPLKSSRCLQKKRNRF